MAYTRLAAGLAAGLAAAVLYAHGFCNVTLLTGRETNNFLKRDTDGFLDSLSVWDCAARGADTKNKYKGIAAHAGVSFTTSEAAQVRTAARTADALLLNHADYGVDGRLAASLPWRIAKVLPSYENGLPHTRSDTIFISEMPDVNTLIHEKVHVYQRMYPNKIHQYLESAGYERERLRSADTLIQANPDVDAWTYMHPQTKKPMRAVHAQGTMPRKIPESDGSEHPYEEIAYSVAAELTS